LATFDVQRVDTLLKFILATAGEEDRGNRELGPIHLIKYLYLADLAHAERNAGETYTGLPWRFHHFGPWAEEAVSRIEPVVNEIGAVERMASGSKYDGDFVRYSFEDEIFLNGLEREIPSWIANAIQRAVHGFGSDTESLLDFVYKTVPMLSAAPGEVLDFSVLHRKENKDAMKIDNEQAKVLTVRQQKKRKQALQDLKRRFRERLAAKSALKESGYTPPRYDEVFLEGVKWLDSLAGEPIKPVKGTARFSEDIWKSKARYDPDLS
jgi:hypothetical protein